MKVHILMSTYNGESFLSEQIESIRQQTYEDWTLLIRDDGSSDQTRQIISDYVLKDKRICWIDQDSSINLGVVKSFHRLLKIKSADIYLFSDQDDVWLPDKIESQLKAASAYPVDVPLLVYMDLKVVDQELNILNESMIKSQSRCANTTLERIMIENTVTGGVSLINHSLAELWTKTDEIIMHDWYLAILAASMGNLIFLDQPGELYRQHTNNVIGAKTQNKRFKLLRQGPKAIYQRYWKHIQAIQNQVKTVLKELEGCLPEHERAILSNWVDIDQHPLLERYRRLKTYRYQKNKWLDQLNLWITILTTMYKETK